MITRSFVVLLAFGILFTAYSASAQKKKVVERVSGAAESNDHSMQEIAKNSVCSMLHQNMVVKETDEWTIERAKCDESSTFASLSLRSGKRELAVLIKDFETPEQARGVLHATFGQEGFQSYKEFGDDGHKDSANINFIKGRLLVNISFRNFDSDKVPKRFAEHALKAIEGQ